MCVQGAFPARLKKVFIVGAPVWFRVPYNLLSLLLKEKLRERVCPYPATIHTSLPAASVSSYHVFISWTVCLFFPFLFSGPDCENDGPTAAPSQRLLAWAPGWLLASGCTRLEPAAAGRAERARWPGRRATWYSVGLFVCARPEPRRRAASGVCCSRSASTARWNLPGIWGNQKGAAPWNFPLCAVSKSLFRVCLINWGVLKICAQECTLALWVQYISDAEKIWLF